jgi:hypothetical protein
VVAVIRDLPSPTLIELDLVQLQPMPWPRVEELVRLVEPVKDRIFLNGHHWNLRHLLKVDETLTVAYDLLPYLDWLPADNQEGTELQLPAAPMAISIHIRWPASDRRLCLSTLPIGWAASSN